MLIGLATALEGFDPGKAAEVQGYAEPDTPRANAGLSRAPLLLVGLRSGCSASRAVP